VSPGSAHDAKRLKLSRATAPQSLRARARPWRAVVKGSMTVVARAEQVYAN